jgi:hypothetical protein
LNTPTNLLIFEAGGGYDILNEEEFYEGPQSHEMTSQEEIVMISGTITVSP